MFSKPTSLGLRHLPEARGMRKIPSQHKREDGGIKGKFIDKRYLYAI